MRALDSIVTNVEILQNQNLLQEKQIKELAGLMNLTMQHVNLNQEAIRNLDVRLLKLENELRQVKEALEYFRMVWGSTSSMRTALARL